MSDEYASSGYKGSLVNPCTSCLHSLTHPRSALIPSPRVAINDVMPPRERETNALYSDYATKNYPPPGDSTSLLITVSHHHTLTPITHYY